MIKTLHRNLSTKYPWYAKWHAHPHASKIHYAALAVFIGLMLFTLSHSSAKTFYGTAASPDAFAEVNGLHLLKEGEYAIYQSPSKSTKMVKQTVMIKDGGTVTMEVPQGSMLSALSYDPSVPMYVPANSTNVSIHNIADFTNYDGKVDTAIERSLHKKDKVSVIVQLKVPYKQFYDKADSSSNRASKSQSFNNAKSSVASAIGGAGKVKLDLKIVNGISVDVNAKALEALQKNPNVDKVVLDREIHTVLDTSVAEINAPFAWENQDAKGNMITGTGMRIAVIDTGVDYTHPDLGGCFGPNCKVIGGYDFVNNDADPMDDQGHGTHVAATAAGKGLLNGVAPDAKIIAYKVCNSAGGCGYSEMVAAMDKSVDPNGDGDPSDHVDVGTMSIGGLCGTYTDGCGPNDIVSQAVDRAVAAGVIYTIAAGNSGPTASTIGTPGVAQSAITVAAACKAAQVGSTCANPIANFSSRGPAIYNGVDYKKPDIAAPGVLICAARWASAFSGAPTCFDDHHIRISGTSMATPHMAGVAALMRQADPTLTPQQIKDRLKATATSLVGMTYNDQGAGEVNVQTALPLNTKISPTPSLWQVTTDPTKKLSTHTQSFSLKATDASIGSVTLSVSSPTPGIIFTPSKTTLNLSNLGTDSFTGTLTVDNDTTIAGKYTVVVNLMQNGTRVGTVPMVVTVAPTVTVDKDTVDYGVDDPSLATWNSSPQITTVTNKRTDSPQTLTVTKGTFPTGITLQTSATSITIPAGGSVTLSSNFTVTNSSLANGIYSGSLTLSNSANATKIVTKFTKYFVLSIQNPAQDDVAMYVITADGQYGWYLSIAGNTAPVNTVYLNYPGNYHLMVWYNFDLGNPSWPARFVVKENIPVEGGLTTVTAHATEAVNKVSVTPIGIDGAAQSYVSSDLTLNGETKAEIGFKWGFTSSNPLYISNVSNNFHLYLASNNPTASAQNLYMFGGDRVGISGDWNLTNTPSDLKEVIVQHDLNLPSGAQFVPNMIPCAEPDSHWCIGSDSPARTYPFNQHVFTTLNSPGFSFQGWADANSGANHKGYFTIDPFADAGKTIYNGLGPVVWYAGFGNSSSQIAVKPISGLNYGLVRQDERVRPALDATPFSIYKNGTLVSTGSIPSWDQFSDGRMVTPTLTTYAAAPGAYEFRATLPYMSANASLTGTVIANFDTSKSDPNPPYINYLHLSGNGIRSEVYDPTATHTVEMNLNPDGGTLSSVTLDIAADGGAYAPVSLSGSGIYTATLPKLAVTNKIALRLKATDSNGNALQYTFELPKGTVTGTPPPGDTTAPTISLTAPTNGATLSGAATITATANDDIGVTKVEFYQGSTLLATKTAAPYSTNWDTTATANGSYAITAKAYDAAGNVGTSSPVSVTVSNTVQDTTAPTTSITSPANSATVSGVVTVSATASDNVGVDHVDFYRGSTLIGADASAPYSLSWDTSTVTNGSYALTTKAYDAAGNVGTSSAVSVTVSNTTSTTWVFCANEGQTCSFTGTKDIRYGIDGAYLTQTFSSPIMCNNYTFGSDPAPGNTKHCDYRDTSGDTTAPTTAIKSPASGATISGVVTLSASATDNVGVTKVSFYRGSTLIDTDTTGSPDYAITWDTTAVANGSYIITAKAYDAASNVGTSTPITVTVSNGTTPPPGGDTTAPTVSITAPADGSTVTLNTKVTVTASATDNTGVAKVSLYVNNSLLCTVTNAPYSCAWTTPKAANKTYTLTAKAYDTAGNLGTSAPVKVTAKK